MHITGFGIYELPPLKHVHFKYDDRVNLFIGPNASGKSTILRAMENVFSGRLVRRVGGGDGDLVFAHGRTYLLIYADLSDDWPRDDEDEIAEELVIGDTVPILYIPATRVNLPQQDIFSQSIHRPEPYGFDRTWDDILDRHFGNFFGGFNGEYVEDAIKRFRGELGADRSHQNQLRKALDIGYACSKSICPEVIHDAMPHPYVELRDEDDEEQHEQGFYGTGRIVHYDMGIVTTDDILGEPLYAGALSSGTQGTLLWIYALALKMANHYGWTPEWENKPAILLIDEIENHLHPTWQRRVIPALLQHFPGLQIFATTHSPFVVAGLSAGQVHMLKRDADGGVTATTNERDIIGWATDEILQTFMAVDEPTDQLTVDRASRLRELRGKETLSDAEAEEITELRRRVNEDFISSSTPLEAQRERYGEMMLDFLRSRDSELSQDGN